jgi:hypothetical protein
MKMNGYFLRLLLSLPGAPGQVRILFVGLGSVVLGANLQAAPLVAADDQTNTLQNTAVTIPVLANDSDAPTNQLAILQVTKPAHGNVIINSNGPVVDAELSFLFQFAGMKLSNSVVQIRDTNLYPRATQTNGTWATYPVGIYNWVSGFLPGCLWYLYEQSGDVHYRTWAESWMAGIAPMQYATEVDDVSFMINTSFGNGYRLVGNPDWRAVVLQTAQSFSTRYNGAAGVLSTWGPVTNQPVQVFIDTMMNLEVLFRAFDLGGGTNFFTQAYSHAVKTMVNHVRADGSTYQIVNYNGSTGAVLSRGTFYGASDESTWARGHSWATYGFALAYRETGDARFLYTSQRLADYYLANIPADYVPYWDFQAPGIPNAPRDSSAASIMLSALLQLSPLATNLSDGARYWQAARHILSSLGSTNYLSQGTSSSGILLHGVGEPPASYAPEIDVSLIYGDYYLIEALRRYADTYGHTTVTYVPNPGFQGTDTFTYEVCNSAGECSTALVSVAVEPAVQSPFLVQISLSPGSRIPIISFPTTADRLYDIEYQTDLPVSGPWSALATNITGSGLVMSVSDTNPASRRYYRVAARDAPAPPQEITLQAPSGVITSPFIITSGYIYQPFQTNLANAGRAAYSFSITAAGSYVIRTMVNAPGDGANSFFLNIDAEPQDPYMIWDIPITAGFEQRVVTWRGNGTFDNNEFVPKVFDLTQGPHQLIIRGREANTLLQSMTLMRYP